MIQRGYVDNGYIVDGISDEVTESRQQEPRSVLPQISSDYLVPTYSRGDTPCTNYKCIVSVLNTTTGIGGSIALYGIFRTQPLRFEDL